MEISCKAKDKNSQLTLNNILNDFKISVYHMGNSYFRVNDQCFLVTTGKLVFWYPYAMDMDHKNKQPVQQTGLLQEIKNSVYAQS